MTIRGSDSAVLITSTEFPNAFYKTIACEFVNNSNRIAGIALSMVDVGDVVNNQIIRSRVLAQSLAITHPSTYR
jgi:hypothetical protein